MHEVLAAFLRHERLKKEGALSSILTNSMVLSPSSEAASCAAIQEFPNIL
jgi:hypothetical protein